MRLNDSRPFAWSSSMMRRSRSSTVRAGVTGPRGGSSFSASTLRNAWESYQETTHSVNGLDFGRKIADVEPMPRTPLLRALRRLADDVRAAARPGIPVAEPQARRAEDAAYARRAFITRA